MVTKQYAASGGLWLNISGEEILIDPGPGSLVQSTNRKLHAERLSAIILSHRHIDHSTDINIMIEAMTGGGFHKRGTVFAPADALNHEPVIYSYLRDFPEHIEVLEEGKSYTIGPVSFTTPIRHQHSVETYGMFFHTAGHTFSYVADSRYFEGLSQHYRSELIILNVVLLEERPHIAHLSIPDARRIITDVKPKVALLTHFGTRIWQAKPWEIAQQLSLETGVRVVAAHDGMSFDLSELEG